MEEIGMTLDHITFFFFSDKIWNLAKSTVLNDESVPFIVCMKK